MAGSRRATRFATSIAAAGIATTVVSVAATQPASISASLIDLSALIVVGSSTNPTGAGVEDFFGGKFNDPIYTGPDGDDIVFVDFRTGPQGIQQALDANAGERNAVLASGWGAANASLLALRDRSDLDQTVLIFDNDVARPDGGFGTRYPWFALIGVNPIPTPSEVPALAAVNIGYQYDYNSNAPADVLNPVAAVNALVSYLDTHRNQSEIDLPVNADGTPSVSCDANTCAVTVSGAVLDCPDARCASPEDRIAAYVTTRANTTYVTYTTEELPLTRLIRDVLGDQIADLTGPVLKLIVDSAYYGGNPIPADPSAYRPARLFPSPGELFRTLTRVPAAIQEGLAAVSKPRPQTVTPAEDSEPEADIEDATSAPGDDTAEDDEASTPMSTPKPALNVVRNSSKALPGQIPAPVATDDESEDVEPQDDSIREPAEPEVADDPDTADTDTEDTDTDDTGAGEGADDAAA
ncbi:PE-PPE domain-containing protein [Mycolicibacterium flavescens]|uniref:PE-PPE domain-containing protein n=1 Tax=Mycolicibacterium flavescens TaxID=1776 RepID=A0A1E3RN41_MYCFV|nr:PE-PPE domain-containing protein [Mycolicibacterium flavescens]MCV7281187.1 PE-PPE domain-containing protein [Mycolicibacterium flavescens]ODQ91281.1 PE-PPE domain-containing protein [Mycolicibacterium flavescens]